VSIINMVFIFVDIRTHYSKKFKCHMKFYISSDILKFTDYFLLYKNLLKE